MAERPLQRSFSFNANDDDIFRKPQTHPQLPYKHACDRTGYHVSPSTSYMRSDPPRESSPEPSLPLVSQPPAYPSVPALDSYPPYRNSRADLEALRQDYGRSPSPDFPDFSPTPLNLVLSYGANGLQQHSMSVEPTTPRKPLPALPPAGSCSAQLASYNSPPPPPAHRALSRRPSDEDTSEGQHPSGMSARYNHQWALHDGMNSPASAYSAQSPNRPYADHRLSGPPGSFSSGAGMLGAAAAPGLSAPSRPSHESFASGGASTHRNQGNLGNDLGYHYPPSRAAASMAEFCNINPTDLAEDDDDEDGLDYARTRGSPSKQRYLPGSVKAGAPVAFLKSMSSRGGSGQYGKLTGGTLAPSNASNGGGGGGGGKSEWLDQQTTGNKRLKWLVGGAIVLIIVLAIVGGVIGAVVGAKKPISTSVLPQSPSSSPSSSSAPSSSSSPGSTGTSLSGSTNSSSNSSSNSNSSSSTSSAGLTKDSPAIKALLNNPALHKVFPGIDYTPSGAQYPACLTAPPSQDDVTKDVAVLSQLTPAIRLYGTDCNQTQLVLHAIAALGLGPAAMKVWLGVWQDANATTNARQLAQLWDVLDVTSASASASTSASPFAGVIVGNEVLFRQDMAPSTLAQLLADVRANVTRRGLAASLPVATSDLGSAWTPALAAAADVVMANIHPFFAGVAAADAAAWTYAFWQGNDVALAPQAQGRKRQIISEVGWPSGGGSDCGTDAAGVALACADAGAGSVAGVAQLNRFLADWVCPSLANGTEYFWFEAFDEPWKDVYNTPTQQWEDKWGLMDVQRNLKAGVTIPDCGGARAG